MLFFYRPDSVRSQADTAGADIIIELGEVRITAREKDPATRVLDHQEMDQFNRKDVAGALGIINGLNFVNMGSRNESMITVRGFDLRQVPVYLDGVPVYVPYDGYVDLGKYLVHDLAKISVSKGVSSVLFGPNTLGGAINLVTGKPVKKMEISGSTGVKAGSDGFNGWHSDLNLGGRMGRFYYRAGYSLLDHNEWYLSDKYVPANPDDNLVRENSDRKDLKLDIKAGFIPDNTDEYSIAYYNQLCSKGVPVYAGMDPRQQVRYWRFRAMDNQGIKLITKTALGTTAYLKTRIFYDRYLSDLRSFDDSSYSTQNRRSSFTSIYSDESFGGNAEYNFNAGLKHILKAVVHYKYDHHSEHNTYPIDETVRHFRDQYLTFGGEENYSFSSDLLLIAGSSCNIVNNIRADNYNALNDSVFPFPASGDASLNAQFGLDYRITEKQELLISLARKTRFATMKDRYSYRLGRSIPNPSLHPESGIHADVSYALHAGQFLRVSASLFCSRLDDVIQQVYGVDPENSAVYQYRNTGRAVFYGMETEMNVNPFPFLQARVQYTFLERKNLSHPELLFTDVPGHRIFGFLKLYREDRFYVQFSSDFNSERPSTNDGLYVAKAFLVCDLMASARLCRYLSVEGGIKNLFDASYSYTEGYPEEGRNYFLSLRYAL
jgi:iron complex outermembrane receptor protein